MTLDLKQVVESITADELKMRKSCPFGQTFTEPPASNSCARLLQRTIDFRNGSKAAVPIAWPARPEFLR
jgi:hypothetical protein